MNLKSIFRVMATIVVLLAASAMCSQLNAQITDIQVFSKKGSPFSYHRDRPAVNYTPVLDMSIKDNLFVCLDCNKNSGTDVPYVSIFYKEEDLKNNYVGKAIADVIVIEGEKTTPPNGYLKVDHDLNKGCGSGSKFLYLAFRRATASDTHIITGITGYSFDKENKFPKLRNEPSLYEELVTKYGVATPADLAEKCGRGTDYIRLVVEKKKIK